MRLTTSMDVRHKKFNTTWLRHGFDMDEVDEFLDEQITPTFQFQEHRLLEQAEQIMRLRNRVHVLKHELREATDA